MRIPQTITFSSYFCVFRLLTLISIRLYIMINEWATHWMIWTTVNITTVGAFAVRLFVQLKCCIRTNVFDVFCGVKIKNFWEKSESSLICSPKNLPFPSALKLPESFELLFRLLWQRTAWYCWSRFCLFCKLANDGESDIADDGKRFCDESS